MNKQQSSRARERRLRNKYRRLIKVSIAVSLIIGLVGGCALGVFFGPSVMERFNVDANKSTNRGTLKTTETPDVTPTVSPAVTLEATPTATVSATPTAEPTATPEPVATPTPAPENVLVKPGETQTIVAQIYSDGTVRKDASDKAFETLEFEITVSRYLTTDYYQSNYASQYRMQGNETGVEFEVLLKDYEGALTIMPQELFTIKLETEDGVVEQGYKLTDAEVEGKSKVVCTSNEPKMFYKRFKFDESVGEMAYLTITNYVDGVSTKYMFDLSEPEPEVTATPEPVQPTTTTVTTTVTTTATATASSSVEAPSTYEKLEVTSRGDGVQALQAKLIELGYLTGTADGRYGEMTRDAVKAAQADLGLEETGIADVEFQKKLFGQN